MPKSRRTEKNFGTQTEDNVQKLISSARAALENGDFERAEDDLQLGLAICGKTKNPTQIPHIYDILSAMAFSKGNLEKAASILQDAVKELTLLGFPDSHHHITDFRFRLARIFSSFSKSETAENGFQSSIEELKKTVDFANGSQHSRLLYANFLFRYGLYKIRSTEYVEAKQIIQQALEHFKLDRLQPRLLKFISCTLSDLSAGIACDNEAVEKIGEILPVLRIPEAPKISNQRSSTSRENFRK